MPIANARKSGKRYLVCIVPFRHQFPAKSRLEGLSLRWEVVAPYCVMWPVSPERVGMQGGTQVIGDCIGTQKLHHLAIPSSTQQQSK